MVESFITSTDIKKWLFIQNKRMRAKVANALSREIQLIATPVVGGLIQPERLLLGILVTTMGRGME